MRHSVHQSLLTLNEDIPEFPLSYIMLIVFFYSDSDISNFGVKEITEMHLHANLFHLLHYLLVSIIGSMFIETIVLPRFQVSLTHSSIHVSQL